MHFLTSSMNTSAPKPCMARAPELVKYYTRSEPLYNFIVMMFAVPIIAIFASQVCADHTPNIEDELRKELSETKAQIAELRELIKNQKQPRPGSDRIANENGDARTAHTALATAREDFMDDRRRLAADAGVVISTLENIELSGFGLREIVVLQGVRVGIASLLTIMMRRSPINLSTFRNRL